MIFGGRWLRRIVGLLEVQNERGADEINFLRSELAQARQDYRELVDAAFRVRGVVVGPHIKAPPPPDWERAGGRAPTWEETQRELEEMDRREAEAMADP
jgi:hypothetical protein